MRVVCVFIMFVLLSGNLWSQDFVQFSARGDVLTMNIYKDASTGDYEFTRLFLSVYPLDTTLFPDHILTVNCDADLGGDRTNCLYPTAFFGASNCLPIQHTFFPAPFFEGRPINKMVTVDRYSCKPEAPLSAGECIQVGGSLLNVFTQGSGNQVLWPWIDTIDWLSGCSIK